jgi:hypothetical protein
MIIFPFSSGCVGGAEVEARDDPCFSGTEQLLSIHAGLTGGLLIAELVDNRCRCNPNRLPTATQPSLAVTLSIKPRADAHSFVRRRTSDLLGTAMMIRSGKVL